MTLKFWVIAAALGGVWASPASPAPGGLMVFPEAGFAPTLNADNSTRTYRLTNGGAGPLVWCATSSVPWIDLSVTGGVLEAGLFTNVVMGMNDQANALSGSNAFGRVTFLDKTPGGGSVSWALDLQRHLPAGAGFSRRLQGVEGEIHLLLRGAAGQDYVVEASEDLEHWRPWATNFLSAEGAFDSVLPPVASPSLRFFRARSDGPGTVAASILRTNSQPTVLVEVTLVGEPGATYLVERSSTAGPWVAWGSRQIDCTGRVLLTNEVAAPDALPLWRAAAVAPRFQPVLHHVLIVGQSLSFGAEGEPALSTNDSERNFFAASDGPLYPLRLYGAENITAGAAAHLSRCAPLHNLVMGISGAGGTGYQGLKKGSFPYAGSLVQFRFTQRSAACSGYGHSPEAIFVVHGESDVINTNYDLDIRQWQEDYQNDIAAMTGVVRPIPMFHSQISAWTSFGNGSFPFSDGVFRVLAESEAHPDQTILVCPKYFLTHVQPLGVHLTNFSYRHLGEYYAKAYRKVIIDGGQWTPLKPVAITRTQAVITARFHVPYPPLVLDTNLVTDPGQFGFEYSDDEAGRPSIVAVALVGEDMVSVTLSRPPTGANPRLRYAFTGIRGQSGGPRTGPRGNLRDSDPEPSLYGNPLYNWCVHFDRPID